METSDSDDVLLNSIYESLAEIKKINRPDFSLEKKLVLDYGLESIDIIDFFFEIQRRTNIFLDLSEISIKIGAEQGRRFNDLTVKEVFTYLKQKKSE